MPLAVYLHGSAAVGHCAEHTPISIGTRGKACQRCGRDYKPSRLLYPVTHKNYTTDPFVEGAWAQVKASLKQAFAFTIFGYSAPETDVDAVSLLRDGWGGNEKRQLEEIELVNVTPEDQLLKSWEAFIHTHHYQYTNSFYETMIAQAPRRSCEAYWEQHMECVFLRSNQLPTDADWPELLAWFAPLIQRENKPSDQQ